MNSSAHDHAATITAIEVSRAIVVLRLREHRKTVQIGEVLAEAGLGVMEVTLDHPDAVDALHRLGDAVGSQVVLGAGTVRTPEQVRRAADVGARFIVSPHTDTAIVEASRRAGLVSIPGACTATDVATAVDAGADFVKLFPAGPLGSDYLRALRGPFRGVRFVPTGGIPHDGLRQWYAAGAVAIGLGSDLVSTDLDELRRRARVVVAQTRAGVLS